MQGYVERSIEVLKNAGVWALLSLLIISLNAVGWLTGFRGVFERVLSAADERALRVVDVVVLPYELWGQLVDGKRRVADLEERVALMAVELARVNQSEQSRTVEAALAPFITRSHRLVHVVRLIQLDTESRIAFESQLGVSVGQVVIDTKGVLIGKVKSVGRYSALLLRPFDRESRIPVKSMDGAVHGVLVGDGRRVMLQEVLQGEPLAKGAVLVTSGVGGDYPEGLVVGQVELVTGTQAEVTKGALVTLLHEGGTHAALIE